MSDSKKKKILLCVCGGIAAYKACEVLRLLQKEGYEVRVVMTKSATEFVTPLTFQTLSGFPVSTNLFDLTEESEIGHIKLADESDLVLIAPATANMIAKAAHGMADDALSTILLATKAPIIWAPSMNVNMYNHTLTQENLSKLKGLGQVVVDPDEGELACGWVGKGRLAEPKKIVEAVSKQFSK